MTKVDAMEPATDGTVDRAVDVFRTFGNATRLRLMRLLSGRDDSHALCVGALASRLGVSQSAVSQHLRVLKGADLVRGERRGYRVHYFVNSEALERCRQVAQAALEPSGEGDGQPCPEPGTCRGDR